MIGGTAFNLNFVNVLEHLTPRKFQKYFFSFAHETNLN